MPYKNAQKLVLISIIQLIIAILVFLLLKENLFIITQPNILFHSIFSYFTIKYRRQNYCRGARYYATIINKSKEKSRKKYSHSLIYSKRNSLHSNSDLIIKNESNISIKHTNKTTIISNYDLVSKFNNENIRQKAIEKILQVQQRPETVMKDQECQCSPRKIETTYGKINGPHNLEQKNEPTFRKNSEPYNLKRKSEIQISRPKAEVQKRVEFSVSKYYDKNMYHSIELLKEFPIKNAQLLAPHQPDFSLGTISSEFPARKARKNISAKNYNFHHRPNTNVGIRRRNINTSNYDERPELFIGNHIISEIK